MNVFACTAACQVECRPDLLTSTHDCDKGSTYQELVCSQCDSTVGKIYLTTNRKMDAFRDMLTFEGSAVQSHSIKTSLTVKVDSHLEKNDNMEPDLDLGGKM